MVTNREFYRNSDEELDKQSVPHKEELAEGTTEMHDALRSMDTETGGEEDAFKAKERRRMRVVAKNVIDSFGFNPEKETMLVITDREVWEKNPLFLHAIKAELEERIHHRNKRTTTKAVGNYEFITIPPSHSATPLGKYVGDKMRDRPVLIVTSHSRSHSPETGDALQGSIPAKGYFDAIITSQKFTKTVQEGKSVITLDGLQQLQDEAAGDDDVNYYRRLKELARKTRSRIISITKGTNPFEVLNKGAVEESVEVLGQRAAKVQEMMQDVVKVKITTSAGTDLTLYPRLDKTEIENGRVDKPGMVSNYPIGEWSCSPYLERANGTLIVDVAAGGRHMKDQFDTHGPIRLEIKDGVVTAMNNYDLNALKELLSQVSDYDLLERKDDESTNIEQLKKVEREKVQMAVDKFLEEQNINNSLMRSLLKYWIEGDNRAHHCFRLAEFAMGTNAKACQGKPPKYIGSSEGEKMLGTVHVAVGSNGSFDVDERDPNFNDVEIHCDMVVSKPTVVGYREDGTNVQLINNGEAQFA